MMNREDVMFKETDQRIADALRQEYMESVLRLEIQQEDPREPVDSGQEALISLARRVKALPEKVKAALYGVYYFRLPAEDITLFYGVDHPMGVAAYYRDALSTLIGLDETKRISDRSMYEVCEQILQAEWEETEPAKKKDGNRRAARRKRILRTVVSVAAAFFLFCMVGVTASAKLRSWFVQWIIVPHEEYSEVRPVSDRKGLTVDGAASYYPTYIPEEFTENGESLLSFMKHYEYLDSDGYYLSVDITIPDHISNLNTENATIEDGVFRGEHAFYILHDDGINIFSCVIDGYPVHIYGRTSKEELLKIAEGIRRCEE